MNYNYESFNDELMKHVSTVVATFILLTTASSGCLENGFFGNENNGSALASPIWKKGDFWEYSVTIDNKQFLVIYASETKITLINLNTLEELNLFINNEGELMDNTITDISLLSRDITPSYALQNNLTPKNWIDITFKGDVPSIVTGEITNLEEDMIEIKLYPSNKLIYIDKTSKGQILLANLFRGSEQ